jgi:hypothetical protein
MDNCLIEMILFKQSKIKFFILLCFCIICSNINAQNSEQQFGLRLSGALVSFLDSDLPNRYSPRGLSYDIGLYTHTRRNNRAVGIAIEVNYKQRNVKDDFTGYSLNYLSVGLFPNYHFVQSGTTIFIGCNAELLARANIITDNPKGTGDYFSLYDVSLIAGFSQKLFDFNPIYIDLDTRFNLGFRNIKQSYWGIITRNYGLSIGFLIKKNARKTK